MENNENEEVNKENEERSKYNKTWGCVICFGTVITFVASIGHVNSLGLIYNDFIKETYSSSRALTSANGVFSIMLALGGILLNIMLKRLTPRKSGLIGASIFISGSLATVFIKNMNQMPLTFGVLQGIGFGIMVPVCYSTINHYYVTTRTTVMSICKAVQGVIMMVYPQFLKRMMEYYGFRGTLVILFGISLHTLVGMMTMVEKRAFLKTDGENENANDNLLKNQEKEVKWDETNVVDEGNEDTSRENRCKLLELLDLRSLRDPVYCNICLGQSFVNFSDITFFVLQPMLLFQYGYVQDDVAICISIGAGADLLGRSLLAVISILTPLNTRVVFYVATLLTFIMRIVLLQVRKFWPVAAVTAVLGLLRAWLHVASPVVISNHVTHHDFPGAYALFMLATGVVNVTLAPLIGLIKDLYGDYVPAFYAMTLCCLPCILLWPLEYFTKITSTTHIHKITQ